MKSLILSSLFALSLTLVPSAYAAGNQITSYPGAQPQCPPVYGGGTACPQIGNVVIDKKVARPGDGVFVDNLSLNDPKFAPDQSVTFQLTVTNTGNAALEKVTVKDIFPTEVTFVSGAGNYDANTRSLTFDLLNLQPNESRTFTLIAKVNPATQLPDNQASCVINQSIAQAPGMEAKDNAQFCIEKPGVPSTTKGGLKVFPPQKAVTTPPTGPEAIILSGLLTSGILGVFLRKKAI